MLQSAQETTGEASFHSELVRFVPAHILAESDFRADNRGEAPESNSKNRWELKQAEAYCRKLAHRHYENFTVVSFLLPRKYRQDFYNIYAFCRWSDDLADEVDDPELSTRLLNWWQREFSRGGAPGFTHPVLLALQTTIRQNALPKHLFTDLLKAFRQDQYKNRYLNHSELLDYCSNSANPVGRILLALARSLNDENGVLSDSVCTGLQLANFCQDMHRDAIQGRIYAPRELWERHGVSESMILAGQVTPELQAMLREWTETTRQYFHHGHRLVDLVPRWLATDVDLFVRGGLAILDQIEKANFDVWTARPTVSKLRKFGLLVRSRLPSTRRPGPEPVVEAKMTRTQDLSSDA